MIIAIASGKGGTGKTTISVAIANAIKGNMQLLDCDVEEPNVHLFFDMEFQDISDVFMPVPVVDKKLCTLCGKCAEVCEFNAIAVLKDNIMVFNELCHSCGGCTLVCPQKAISEHDNPIGQVAISKIDNINLIQGKLNVGCPTSPPLIRAVKKHIKPKMLNILDCPPGNACPVITAINGADYIILVTEATPFGLNDLKISVDTMREVGIPFGVVINRCDTGDSGVVDYLKDENIDILLEIPENMEAAKAYSNGNTIISAMPEVEGEIIKMIDKITRDVS